MEVGRAIYNILKNDNAVSQTVGTRISPNVMSQTSAFPFIVYDVASDSPDDVKDTTAPLDEIKVMISGYAEDYNTASKLANYIRTALDRKSGNYYGIDVQSIDFDGYDDIFDDDSGADGIYRKALDFTMRITNSLNNIYSTEFDGVDDYVDIDSAASTISSAAGSISLWVKLGNMASSGNFFRVQVDGSNLIHLFYHASSDEIRFGYNGGGSATIATITDSIENDGNWHHLVGTWSTSANEIKIYLDGTLKDTTSSLNTLTGTFSAAGIGWNLTSNYYLGNIDEVSVFNAALSASDVTDIYNSGYPATLGDNSRLIGWWKMGDGATYPTIPDDSSNSNNGTLTNGSSADFVADVPEG